MLRAWMDGSCYPGHMAGAAVLVETGEYMTLAVRAADSNVAELHGLLMLVNYSDQPLLVVTDSKFIHNSFYGFTNVKYCSKLMDQIRDIAGSRLIIEVIPKSKNSDMHMRLVDNLARMAAQTQLALRGEVPWVREENKRCQHRVL